MVEHVWQIMTGRTALRPPADIDDPLYPARRRAYGEQHAAFEEVARRLTSEDFHLKVAFKRLALSPFYRADGVAAVRMDPARQAELEDAGLARLLAPEQLERKVAAVFGEDWGRLHEQFKILYGGIDSKEVTERIADPSGAMGAIQRMMANEVACRNVALDFSREPGERLLFPGIEPDVVPDDADRVVEAKLRAAMAHLHAHILGCEDAVDSEEVNRTYGLFKGVIEEARERGQFEKNEIYHCRVDREKPLPDPHYTLRAWRAVVTYLLRQYDFLYE
jgi:hypothetical protein